MQTQTAIIFMLSVRLNVLQSATALMLSVDDNVVTA